MASTITTSFKTEEQLQVACYTWFHNTFPLRRKLLFHVDNNSWNAVIGSRKKALGVNAGVSDFVLVLFMEVVWIEMKLPGAVQNDDQKEFQMKVEQLGHRYIIIRSLQQFQDYINKIYE